MRSVPSVISPPPFQITAAVKKEIERIVDARIREAHVTREDFTELKGIVSELAAAQKELAAAQQRTEQRVSELAVAQQRTEQRVEELAAAQQRTEQRVEELATAQKELAEAMKETQHQVRTLARELQDTRSEVGGLSRTIGYALENEAYRMLPAFLKDKYHLRLTERFVRTTVGGEEINLFARGRRNGKEVLLVGETKSRLDERRGLRAEEKDVFQQLADKVQAVQAAHPKARIVPLIVTHFARPKMLEEAQAQGIIVVQSFEW